MSLGESSYRFRGQSNFSWSLQPTIYRFDSFKRYQAVQYERFVLDHKPPKPNPPLTHTDYDIEWLMLSQHYGVPTRLLDWTTDILIELFFSCSGKEIDNDGALFICDQSEYPKFSGYNDRAVESQELSFINTTVINPRVRSQSGCFMMWGHSPLDEHSTESYDLWEYHERINNTHNLKKICIPQDSKKIILNELKDIYSITEGSIYLQDGYLEKTYFPSFETMKENARLMTLYTTDAERLNELEEIKARSMFRIECKNMIGSCENLRKI